MDMSMKKLLVNLPKLLKLSYDGWKKDRASRLSASLAYYTIFSLSPMLVIVIAITGLLWEAGAVRTQILNQIQGLIGAGGAEFIANLITRTGGPANNIFATIIGILTLLFGALGVFNELHNSLNIIWDVEEEEPKGIWQTVKKVIIDRLLSFTMILGIGFMLLVSLVISTALSAMQQGIGNLLPLSDLILQLINLVISLAAITVLFGLMFKFLPDAKIAWQDVWLGAFVTALLFSIGKTLIGLYLGNSSAASAFGAAGSLILLLLWIYYSAQIFFFGAEFTEAYANLFGSKILPEGQARLTEAVARQARSISARPAVPPGAVVPVTGQDPEEEREASQFARLLLGSVFAAFVTGVAATVFGFGKRK
jgi:membrane protein